MPQPNSACDNSVRGRDPQAAIAAERALSLLRHVHVVVGGIVDHAGDDLALALERDRDGEDRDGVQEVGRRVERVDMPGVALVGSLDPSAFLHHEAVARTRLGELFVKRLLRALVGETDEIARPLHRHLQLARSRRNRASTPRPALIAALVITVIRAERIMAGSRGAAERRRFRGCAAAEATEGSGSVDDRGARRQVRAR